MRLTKHALERALDMAVAGDEIRDCYLRPQEKKWSVKHECWTYKRGQVALAVRYDEATEEDVVVTVLWATQEAWKKDFEHGAIEGRTLRADMHHLRRK